MQEKFKVDENLPVEVAELLQQVGYDAATILEQSLTGEKDLRIATVCQHEKRALITLDVDFADIRAYPPAEFSGLIVMRLNKQDKHTVLRIVQALIKTLKAEEVDRRLWIVSEDQIRIRE